MTTPTYEGRDGINPLALPAIDAIARRLEALEHGAPTPGTPWPPLAGAAEAGAYGSHLADRQAAARRYDHEARSLATVALNSTGTAQARREAVDIIARALAASEDLGRGHYCDQTAPSGDPETDKLRAGYHREMVAELAGIARRIPAGARDLAEHRQQELAVLAARGVVPALPDWATETTPCAACPDDLKHEHDDNGWHDDDGDHPGHVYEPERVTRVTVAYYVAAPPGLDPGHVLDLFDKVHENSTARDALASGLDATRCSLLGSDEPVIS